jgi:hypothetical protein
VFFFVPPQHGVRNATHAIGNIQARYAFKTVTQIQPKRGIVMPDREAHIQTAVPSFGKDRGQQARAHAGASGILRDANGQFRRLVIEVNAGLFSARKLFDPSRADRLVACQRDAPKIMRPRPTLKMGGDHRLPLRGQTARLVGRDGQKFP